MRYTPNEQKILDILEGSKGEGFFLSSLSILSGISVERVMIVIDGLKRKGVPICFEKDIGYYYPKNKWWHFVVGAVIFDLLIIVPYMLVNWG